MLVREVSAYRIVLVDALQAITGIPSINLTVKERREVYKDDQNQERSMARREAEAMLMEI